jgi:diguanylate cyclase (GGDEF)-like protein
MEQYRILHIEDNAGDARLVQIYAAEDLSLDLKIEHVETIAQARDQLEQEQYDLLLLDLNLPASRGIDSLIQIMDFNRALPVIVLTALDDRGLGVKAVKLGAQDFLLKGPGLEHNLSRAVRYAIERYKQLSLQRELSLRDELTALYNRRGLNALADQQFRLAIRRNEKLSLFLADVDGLKEINDRFGHQAGDDALRDIARAMKLTFRSSDILARVGGDEFVVIAVDTQGDVEAAILGRWRQTLADYLQETRRPYSLSMSVGVVSAATAEEMDLDRLIDLADKSMYLEKMGSEMMHSRESAQ